MSSNNGVILMDGDRVERSLKRIAFQISEANRESDPLMLIGINERGHIVARKLAEYLDPIYSDGVKVRQLLVDEKEWSGTEDEGDYFIVLVDDVIFSGHTMFRALQQVFQRLNPTSVHTVTLVDRGHRKIPVEAQFTGMVIPTKFDEHVHVRVEDEEIREVELTRGESR